MKTQLFQTALALTLLSGSVAMAQEEVTHHQKVLLRGTIFKSNKQETVSFGLTFKGDGANAPSYTVSGSTVTDKGFYQSDMDFSTVEVKKLVRTKEGGTLEQEIENHGVISVFPRQRVVKGNLTLAGQNLRGLFVQGMVDDMLKLSDLVVNNQACKGKLDYNSANGHYNSKDTCTFGDCAITSSEAGMCVMDYDNYVLLEQNTLQFNMVFGELRITGKMIFADQTHTTHWSDEDGNGTSDTTVTATQGQTNLEITRHDGKPFQFSKDVKRQTADEVNLLKFISWLELMAFDVTGQ